MTQSPVTTALDQRLPRSVSRLTELAYNLWWSWNLEARHLFETMDPTLWYHTRHNPVELLAEIKTERLLFLAQDPGFARQYTAVFRLFDEYVAGKDTWFQNQYPALDHACVAYFSAEFGLHNSIPIYSGGLGILAGDHCKEASDLGVPLVGIGFMYPQGYFKQRISPEGWQEATYAPFAREKSPIQPALTGQGTRVTIKVEIGRRVVTALVWQVRVGRVRLYLIDTDTAENPPEDRALSARLYGGDHGMRLSQEILLGMGGVRILRVLGIEPTVWHANEGHSAFLVFERMRELVQSGRSFAEAREIVRQSTVFTTHTPVPAGHDVFPFDLMDHHLAGFHEKLGLSRQDFLRMGETPQSQGQGFNMTALAMRMATRVNAVSREHGGVTRKMWQHLWPDMAEDRVPIRSITNGIHAPTWISPELHQLYGKYLTPTWTEVADDSAVWQRAVDIPDPDLWSVLQASKRKLMGFIRERSRSGWVGGQLQASQVIARGTLLDPEALTLGFARRFATYKRATLIFRDIERLKQLLQNRWRPVQIVFAGKAHPADEPGRYFIHEVVSYCHDHKLGGHIAFLEDYDMHMAKYLVQGVDVWLNTPRPPMEASGTSGQKAALNGALNLSVLDGWWQEGYNGANGWAIGGTDRAEDPHVQDERDAQHLYEVLEKEVIPLYYKRDPDGVPRRWLQIVKESLRTIAPQFCTKRMLKEYVNLLYFGSEG